MPPSPSDLAVTGTSTDVPGWTMAPCSAADAGFDARGSWLLEPDTGTGMLLYPRDWTFLERRDVTAHLRAEGWSVVPITRFLHLTSDGTTAIRLLARTAESAATVDIAARVFALHSDVLPVVPADAALEATV